MVVVCSKLVEYVFDNTSLNVAGYGDQSWKTG